MKRPNHSPERNRASHSVRGEFASPCWLAPTADGDRYPTFNVVRRIVISVLALSWMSCLGLAQEQALPAIRILPADIVQESVQELRMGRSNYAIRWTYTEAGAKKMLAFWKAHDGQEVITRVGSFESRNKIKRRNSYPAGWVNDEGWLKSRTDKFFGVSEEDAKAIKSGLKSR